uniref:NADH-ubiquinone oxidoreductase chain 6 n=1 Tax=Apatides fortis TaxID=590156 RepID=D1G5P5_APAFO|nr:NADH dehydrogenase subunit 6 [Apatides fortis]ACM45060.1 NADH dehydrogenase subunit 6 [Apatides fortis]
MKIMLTLLMISTWFVIASHPLTLALIMIINTVAMAIYTGWLNMSYWYSFMLFMIMIGGMLVLIMYMTSIAANEPFDRPWKFLMIMTMFMTLMIITDSLNLNLNINTQDSFHSYSSILNLSLNKYINPNHISIIILMINYLFVTLIAIVKITNIKYGSLRQKF